MAVIDPFPDPYPAADFDAWADTYDDETTAEEGFPFTGYSQVIDGVIAMSNPLKNARVLDLGTGTGILAGRMSALGSWVVGVDFSPRMLAVARGKYPQGTFIESDLRAEQLPQFQLPYDRIVSAYTFHHFPLAQKVALLHRFALRALAPDGWLVIADLSFPDHEAMDIVRLEAGERWEIEDYWIAEAALPALARVGLSASYHQVSNCAGIYRILLRK